MTYALIIILVVAFGLGVALYFQIKASSGQAEEQQKLLADYQCRVDEQQKLLDDYRALEKNFDNVGEGYEQALLAFDKLEEDSQKAKAVNEALEKRCTELQNTCNHLQQVAQKSSEVIGKTLQDMRHIAAETDNSRLLSLVGKIADLDDIEGNNAIPRVDNIMVAQIANDAVKASGIDQVSYLQFSLNVAEDAAYTMLHTNQLKASRALTHLLDNALKFTTEGSVTLSVSVDMDKMQASYVVEDTGSGIAVEDAERIFDPYYKQNQFFDGDGVGLTVARSIANRLDGSLVLDTEYAGPGARFVLTLPI